MTSSVFIAALASALLHACWNALTKVVTAPRDLLFGISLATASLCAVAFPFVGPPALATLPWIVASSLCNLLYLRLLSEAYTRAPFALVYTLVRAVVPPTVFLLGWAVFTESGGASAYIGMALVAMSLVIFAAAKSQLYRAERQTLLYSLGAGVVLSCALLFDVIGIRIGGGDWLNLLRFGVASSLATAGAIIATKLAAKVNPLTVVVDNMPLCYTGALLLLVSYLSGMWAYAQGPIGLVASLRESGILFGGLLAVSFLREHVSRMQWAAMGIATIGVLLIRIG